ncbi:MAG: pyruvate:ferredoxin (flavodoxin) oxidoreductase [Alistipes sp.]|jgi:pyruvate-ferredoxin/flavodoxin oxidoreductase|nr:pyruvate:ferredoxin (flavodoxin) oxidoreductase [Alistipes sp.]
MKKEKKFVTCDGNYAAAHIAYMFSEVAAIYPITPSSTMAEYVDEWSAGGRKNIFGETVKVVEMQSEAGAAGAVHGSLQAGALTNTFTASQGLLLMIPNMYKIAGELLPAVFHVSARALAASSLSIFGDHQDVMATRQTGFAMIATSSVQEVMDLAGVAHLASLESRVPFLHFFDGFRTSHEIQKIEMLENGDLAPLMDRNALAAFRERALNPESPVTKGTAQNSDIYFQSREAGNRFWDAVPDTVAKYMAEISKITGRTYKPFTYYGDPEATDIVVAMGSISETLQETIDYLRAQGRKVGMITVHLYRPFSEKYFFDVLPASVKRVCVLDRTKEVGAPAEPLYLDVQDMFYGKPQQPAIVGGRYGLASKDTTPADMVAVFDNLASATPRDGFTVGINDDVTHLSLTTGAPIALDRKGTFEGVFFGLGADGTVGANKNSIKIIGDTTDKYCQAYFAYDSKKSGGYTASHLRFGDEPIRSPYLVTTPDFVACHVPSYVHKYNVLKGLKKGGSFLLNTLASAADVAAELPAEMKAYLAKNDINFYIINATKLAADLGLGNRTNTIMQSAFFKISGVIPFETAVTEMKNAIKKSYGRKGEEIVAMNNAAVDAGGNAVEKVTIPSDWATATPAPEAKSCCCDGKKPDFVKNVVEPVNNLKGDDLPVSAFAGREDGTWDNGTAAYEKRGIAVDVPQWNPDNCIQCNQCSYVCPHAAIRPFLATEAEVANAPEGTAFKQGLAETKDYKFRIQVSPLDCTGCGNCVDVCPAKTKALTMMPLASQKAEEARWEYMHHTVGYKESAVDKTKNVKNSQFAQPLFEFSGACAGCGETPYIKTVTQLFGESMIIANATGCSSIFSGSAPSTPYCVNARGFGPAWGNSLFEDNAEFGLGMQVATEKLRDRVEEKMRHAIAECNCCSPELKGVMQEWIDHRNDRAESREITDRIIPMLEKCGCDTCQELLKLRKFMARKSQWIIGGDGWAYDIGFGGLDHVLASGLDVNILVVDTEVYSNTGGQSSKATPVGAIAKFASSGKRVRKKDLGAIAMTYGYVYVAQVSIGANQNQLLKVLKEAESYEGPSIVIAYAPCINHGIKGGMTRTPSIGKEAVESGYWHLWHYDPRLADSGQNPFTMDSKEPDWTKFRPFLDKEVRYSALAKAYPAEAEELFAAAQENAKWRYDSYRRMAELKY